jgi:hypothetical protein
MFSNSQLSIVVVVVVIARRRATGRRHGRRA